MTDSLGKDVIAEVVRVRNDTKQVPATKTHHNPAERRLHPRHPFSAATEAIEDKTRTRLCGRCADVSLGGCYVDAMSPFPTGARVTVRLKHGARSFESPATVVFSKAGMGMGLAFHDTTLDQHITLEEWIAWLADGAFPVEGENTGTQVQASLQLNERQVLDLLISMLIRKNVLTEKDGASLLSGLFR
jgi:hypothetical protein